MNRYAIALLLVGLAAVACDKSAPKGDQPSPSASTTTSGAKPKIVFIPKSAGNPYFEPLIDGEKKAAEENGCDFAMVAPDTSDATSQIPLIKDQIQQGVAVITISPNSPDALDPVLDEARKKGIAVITVDSDLTGNETHRDASVMPVDPESVGKGQIELAGSLTGYKGEFAILSATSDAPNQTQWIEVMKKALKTDPKYKDMKLVETVYGNDEPQKSLTEAEALLTKHPNLKAIVAPTAVGIVSCAQAVAAANKAATVKVTGLGMPNQMRQYVKDGTVTAFALWSPYDLGYVTGSLAGQVAQKKVKAVTGTKFTAGKMGERTIGDKGVVIAGPPTNFTKDNIDQFKF